LTKHEAPEVIRQRFFEAALDLWAEKGFHATRMDEIAAKAGRSKGSLYHHYASKQELLLAIVTTMIGTVAGDVEQGLAGASSAAGLLRELMQYYAKMFGADRRLIPVFLEFCSISARDEDVRDLFASHYAGAIAAFEQIFAWGVANGEFRADIDTATIAKTFMFAGDGLALTHLVAGQSEGLDRAFATLVDMFIRGISARPIQRK
jgi:AcrR family transcriptional regulator